MDHNSRPKHLLSLLLYALITFACIIFFPFLALSFGQTTALIIILLVGILVLYKLYQLTNQGFRKIAVTLIDTIKTAPKKSVSLEDFKGCFGFLQATLLIFAVVFLCISYYIPIKFERDLSLNSDYLRQYDPKLTNIITLSLLFFALFKPINRVIHVFDLDPHSTKSEGKRLFRAFILMILVSVPLVVGLITVYKMFPSPSFGKGDERAIQAGYERCNTLDYEIYWPFIRNINRRNIDIYITYVKPHIAKQMDCTPWDTIEEKWDQAHGAGSFQKVIDDSEKAKERIEEFKQSILSDCHAAMMMSKIPLDFYTIHMNGSSGMDEFAKTLSQECKSGQIQLVKGDFNQQSEEAKKQIRDLILELVE
ncbi:MAG: hypothetical protein H6855_01365 [Rhodospirillales bacterium]|nr:hypothetical protein [Rhodospirillales bacterium]MCB9964719.1 hypothetical protein [Rhodospirillales bacterium]MCB9980057.1 hypothetical protein [Rhodospirillales bacterium]